ncbi:MAG TPA: hypothetical protein VM534_08985 [Thermoanaerobaculia bacterium]|nr:hypothetical protein [Thermoanaerobaculia bacterium]
MRASTSDILVRVAAAAASAAAGRLAIGGLARPTAVDLAVPWIAGIVVLLGALVTDRRIGDRITLAVPLLIGAAVAAPGEPLRLAAYGVIFAVATASAAIGMFAREATLAPWRAVAFVLLTFLPIGLTGVEPALGPLVFLLGGVALITWIFAQAEGFGPFHLALALAIALVTPLTPWRGALFPLVLGLSLLVMVRVNLRGGGRWVARPADLALLAIALGAGVAAGRWGALIALTAIFSTLFERRQESPAAPLAAFPLAMPGGFPPLIRPLLFTPRTLLDVVSGGAREIVPFAILAGGALLARPFVATAFVLSAASLVSLKIRRKDFAVTRSFPTLLIVFLIIVLFPWSGVVSSLFPLPLPQWQLAAMVAAAAAPLMFAGRFVAGAVGSLLFVVLLVLMPPTGGTRQNSEVAVLAPGERAVFPLARPARRIRIVTAGANVSERRPGETLGWIEMIAGGEGWRRPIRIGETADWGAFRGEQSFFTRNVVPEIPAGSISGSGRTAEIRGSGMILVDAPAPVDWIAVRADPGLESDDRLIVEWVETMDD